MDIRTYDLPEPSLNVLAALNAEATDLRGKLQQAEARAQAVLVAIAAALGIPDGLQIQVDFQSKKIVVQTPSAEEAP